MWRPWRSARATLDHEGHRLTLIGNRKPWPGDGHEAALAAALGGQRHVDDGVRVRRKVRDSLRPHDRRVFLRRTVAEEDDQVEDLGAAGGNARRGFDLLFEGNVPRVRV